MLTDTSVDAGLRLCQRTTQLFDNELRSLIVRTRQQLRRHLPTRGTVKFQLSSSDNNAHPEYSFDNVSNDSGVLHC